MGRIGFTEPNIAEHSTLSKSKKLQIATKLFMARVVAIIRN